MRAILISSCALALLSHAAPAFAEDGTADDASAKVSELVVIGARETSDALHLTAPPADLPIAVQMVTIDTIQDQGFLRLGDAVRDVSGVTRKEAYFGITDAFNIRGFDASTGLFNGFRHDYYLGVIELTHVQSVEVIKGPASVTTGYLEPGGVVNTITKRPTDAPITDFVLQGGSFNFFRGEADISRRINDQLAVRLTGGIETTDSFRDYVGSRHYTGGVAVDWTPTSKTEIDLSAYYTYIDATPDRGLVNDPIDLTLPISRYFGQPSDVYRDNQYEASVLVTQEIDNALSLRGGFDWSRSQDFRSNTQALSLQADGHSYSRDFTRVPGSFDTKTAFVEGDARLKTFGLSHRLTVGVDYTRQDQKYQFQDTDVNGSLVAPIDIYNPNYSVAPPGPVGPDGHADNLTQDVGVYANNLIAVGRFDLLLGIRRDRFTYGDHDVDYDTTNRFAQNVTTPRVGLVYKPVDGLSLYGNYAESFDPQQFVKLANGQNPSPSRGKQTEVGVKYETPDHRYSASFAAFRIDKTNVATPDPSDPTGTFSILTGADRSQGLELDIAAKPIDGLKTLLAVSDIRASVLRDEVLPVNDRLFNVPEIQATFTARYDIPRTPFSVGGSVYYVGRREATLPNTFTIPAYTRVDLSAFYRVTPKIELALNLQNIGDVRYYDSQDYSLYPGAPRSVLGTVRLHF